MTGTVADITQRKQAEVALRESQDMLQLILDSIAEGIYGVDLECRCTFCNFACLRIMGYERVGELLGRDMCRLLHQIPQDGTSSPIEECHLIQTMRTGRETRIDDEVMWRPDGTSFPVEYRCYPRWRGQEIIGALVVFVDITQRKQAESALASVSGRLIEAQELERRRIARELHDDIGQRLALLAIHLTQLEENPPDSPELPGRIAELKNETTGIATDIQSMSHELHSSRLQYLDIVAAMRGLCEEFSDQKQAEIDFNAHQVPLPLPADISLCLFRVLQEALQNAAKHSGARRFKVRLWGAADEIHLTASDAGSGFDIEAAKRSRGLGLISMEERLKLVNGSLFIQSELERGTTIHARVPLSSDVKQVRVA